MLHIQCGGMRLNKGHAASLLLILGLVPFLGSGCSSSVAAGSGSAPCPSGSPLPQSGAAGETWKAPPAFGLSRAYTYTMCMETNKGDIVADLMLKAAPLVVNSFVFLSDHRFYNGSSISRAAGNILVRTGAPKTGTGPGYSLPAVNQGTYFPASTIAMWHPAGSKSDGSRFFICATNGCTRFDRLSRGGDGYTVIGFVKSGMNVVGAIAGARSGDAHINTIRIYQSTAPAWFRGTTPGPEVGRGLETQTGKALSGLAPAARCAYPRVGTRKRLGDLKRSRIYEVENTKTPAVVVFGPEPGVIVTAGPTEPRVIRTANDVFGERPTTMFSVLSLLGKL